jgi:hypothetical protein
VAPFLTHLVIGEQLWPGLVTRPGWAAHDGTFFFGCLAPDVDKFCDGLSQATTHFVAKDAGYEWVNRRTRLFLDHQDEFLRAPMSTLEPVEQAFIAGYLCHVATDEVTGRYGQATRREAAGRDPPRNWIDAFLTVLDPEVWRMARDPAWIAARLRIATVPNGALLFAPPDCLVAMHRIVWPQVEAGGGLLPYLGMLRRHRRWRRYGRVSDAQDDVEIEAELAAYRQAIEAAEPLARQLVAATNLHEFVQRAVEHSRERVAALLAG